MSKYISTNELKEWVENWFYQDRYYHPYSKANNIPSSELYDILERMPNSDLVKVVRCEDCKFSDEGIDEDGKSFLKCIGFHFRDIRYKRKIKT